MRKYGFIWVVITVVVALAVVACAPKPAPTPAPPVPRPVAPTPAAQPATTAAQLPRVISISTNAVGTAYYIVGSGVAKVLNETGPLNVKVEPLSGSTEQILRVDKGEVDFGITATTVARAGWDADASSGFNKNFYSLRLLKVGSPGLGFAPVVRGKSPITSLADLKGKKVTTDYRGHPFSATITELFLVAGGLTLKDVVAVPVTTPVAGVKAVIEGTADAALGPIGSGVMQELGASVHGARLLPIKPVSPEAEKKALALAPGASIKVYPAGEPGLAEPTPVISLDHALFADARMSEDVAYIIAKVLWEQYDKLKVIHSNLATFTPQISVTDAEVIPYHPGAIKFYKEKGVWSAKAEANQRKLLAQAK